MLERMNSFSRGGREWVLRQIVITHQQLRWRAFNQFPSEARHRPSKALQLHSHLPKKWTEQKFWKYYLRKSNRLHVLVWNHEYVRIFWFLDAFFLVFSLYVMLDRLHTDSRHCWMERRRYSVSVFAVTSLPILILFYFSSFFVSFTLHFAILLYFFSMLKSSKWNQVRGMV